MVSDIEIGDQVRIISDDEDLMNILECYMIDNVKYSEISGKTAVVCENIDINSDSFDCLIGLKFENDKIVRLPIALIDTKPNNMVDSSRDNEYKYIRDPSSETAMIRQLAAESIQDAFR